MYALDHDTIDVTFVKVPYAKYQNAATVTDTEVNDYYEQNREAFRRPERVTLTYVTYAPKDLEASVPVTDESIAAYYEAQLPKARYIVDLLTSRGQCSAT